MRVKHFLWMRLGGSSVGIKLLRAYLWWTGRDAAVVSKQCDLVVEGYPRSANTYFVAAFRLAQAKTVKMGHHIHGNQQVLLALKLGVPTVVLIRAPVDVVTSLLVRDPGVGINRALKDYLAFYEPLLPFLGQFVVADFKRAISAPDEIIQEMNQKYGTTFITLKEGGVREEDIIAAVEHMDKQDSKSERTNAYRVGMPSAEKNQALEDMRRKVAEVGNKDHQLISSAQQVYERVVGDSRGLSKGNHRG